MPPFLFPSNTALRCSAVLAHQDEQERRTLDLFLARHQALERLGRVQQVVAELCRQLAALLLDLVEALLGLALPQVTGFVSLLAAIPLQVCGL